MPVLPRIKNFLIAAYFGLGMAIGHIAVAVLLISRIGEEGLGVALVFAIFWMSAPFVIFWLWVPWPFLFRSPDQAWQLIRERRPRLFRQRP